VRPWKWVPFTNPARTDGAQLYHWRRAADEAKEYPFARFNKVSPVGMYITRLYFFDNFREKKEGLVAFKFAKKIVTFFPFSILHVHRSNIKNQDLEI